MAIPLFPCSSPLWTAAPFQLNYSCFNYPSYNLRARTWPSFANRWSKRSGFHVYYRNWRKSLCLRTVASICWAEFSRTFTNILTPWQLRGHITDLLTLSQFNCPVVATLQLPSSCVKAWSQVGWYCHISGGCVTIKTGFGFDYRIYWTFI
jgi:hypothetical protein